MEVKEDVVDDLQRPVPIRVLVIVPEDRFPHFRLLNLLAKFEHENS
jgi:hypothetical protein